MWRINFHRALSKPTLTFHVASEISQDQFFGLWESRMCQIPPPASVYPTTPPDEANHGLFHACTHTRPLSRCSFLLKGPCYLPAIQSTHPLKLSVQVIPLEKLPLKPPVRISYQQLLLLSWAVKGRTWSQRQEFKTQPCSPWAASHIMTLDLGFLVCKMRKMVTPS